MKENNTHIITEDCSTELVKMGIIEKVAPMLQVDVTEVVVNAVTCFGVLAYIPENKKEIREQDALEPIVALLNHTDNEVLERTCGTIQNLALDGIS